MVTWKANAAPAPSVVRINAFGRRSTDHRGSGCLTVAESASLALARAARNTGLSETRVRTQIPMASSSADSRNGIRQPQAKN